MRLIITGVIVYGIMVALFYYWMVRNAKLMNNDQEDDNGI